MKRNEKYLNLKLATIFLAMAFPAIALIVLGDVKSFSVTWNTELQPLFIFTNAVTSYFLFSSDKWRIPALFLLLLTAVSVEFSPGLHDILAGIFFVSCIKPMLAIKRLRFYIYFYLASVPLIFIYNLFWFETLAVWVLCIYHLDYISIAMRIKRNDI